METFSDCDELEFALKQSIEEEARTSLLQAVDDVYYWGGGMWLEDGAEMAVDDAGSATSSTPPPTTRQEGVDYSGTNNIAVYEREPIAMVNSTDLIMLDVDGICLPIEENSAISLPILSNFTTDQESYPLGRKTKSPNAIKSIDICNCPNR